MAFSVNYRTIAVKSLTIVDFRMKHDRLQTINNKNDRTMKKSIVTSIIVILILLTSVVFVYSQNQNLEKKISVLNNKINELEKQKPKSDKPEPTAEKSPEGWKEYIDEEYKFRVWYPKEFTYRGVTDQTKIKKYEAKEDTVTDFYVNILSDAPLRLMYIYISDEKIELEKFIINDIMNEQIDGIDNVSEYIKNDNGFYKIEIPNKLLRYYTKKNNLLYIFYIERLYLPTVQQTKPIFDQMVHSFKFIE